MGDLVRTMIVCGLISGTQPFTIMGLLLLLGGGHGRRNAWWYVFGGFVVQTVIVLGVGVLLGGVIGERDSAPGRTLVLLRVVAGVVLVIGGLWLRRSPQREAPEVPKVFDRLTNLRPRGAFLAGIAIADYQGSVLASAAIAAANVSGRGGFGAWFVYAAIATGVPAAAVIAVGRSERARTQLQRLIDWILGNRRALASWFALIAGLALVADGLTTYLSIT